MAHSAAQSTSKVLPDFLAPSSPIRFAGFPTLPRLPGPLPQASAIRYRAAWTILRKQANHESCKKKNPFIPDSGQVKWKGGGQRCVYSEISSNNIDRESVFIANQIRVE